MTPPDALTLLVYGLAGLALGLANFFVLRLTAALYLSGGAARPVALHLLRLGVVGAALVGAALQGAWPLLAGAAGLICARPIAVRIIWGRFR